MLEKIAPPSLVVDETHRTVHLSELAGRYLQPSGGPVSADAADLVRPELRFDLRAALHRAFERGLPTLSGPIPVQFNGTPHQVLVHVKPMREQEGGSVRHALVLFIEGEPVELETGTVVGQKPNDDVVKRLQEELQLSQNRHRTTREESEATNEELRAANEELQSINEEYRSTSEELETSKEELQSINEELQTVNSELKIKLESVSRAHSDLQNLMAATDIGTLFLDSSLRIKRFTLRLMDLFNITASDEGRPITDFTHQLNYDALADDIRTVLRNLATIEREIQSRNGDWFLVRIRPYRTLDDKIDGIVATFVDITERHQSVKSLRESEERLRQEMRLVELSRSPIFVWDFNGNILQWNRGSEELYGFQRDEAIGQNTNALLRTDVPGSSIESLRQILSATGTWSGELLHRTKDGRVLTVETQIELFSLGDRRLALESTRDITDRKRWEQQQRLLLNELAHRANNTLVLIQSVARQTARNSRSIDEFLDRFEGRLSALSSAHQLLIESRWEGAEVGALVQGRLRPFAGSDAHRIRVEGETVALPADLATRFGLVLHELGANAAKYGALADEKGYVSIRWNRYPADHRDRLRFVWREHDGPPVNQPEKRGFGSILMERGVPEAKVEREFLADGVVCTIDFELPKERLAEVANAAPA
jgi:two-component system CheB/CheR fusion protein